MWVRREIGKLVLVLKLVVVGFLVLGKVMVEFILVEVVLVVLKFIFIKFVKKVFFGLLLKFVLNFGFIEVVVDVGLFFIILLKVM